MKCTVTCRDKFQFYFAFQLLHWGDINYQRLLVFLQQFCISYLLIAFAFALRQFHFMTDIKIYGV